MLLNELRKLPPNDPRRAEHVLGSLHGSEHHLPFVTDDYMLETIRACLREVGAQTVRPPDGPADIAAGILEAAGVFADFKRQHAERCVSDIAGGVACAFGSDNLPPEAIAARACAIFGHIRAELAGPVK